MSIKWTDSIVGEYVELVYGKSLPDRDRQKGEFPVYGSNGIVGQHNQSITKGPGIVIGRKGTVGQVTLSKKDFWPIDTTYYVKLRREGDLFFWFYLLQTLGLDQMNSHSAVPGLNRENVYSIPVKVPPLDEQKKIAKILGDLDVKIELNQQMNKTLEAMAQALFKEWFVDFRFPGYEKVKFIDGLPEGWRSGLVGDAIELGYGKALKEEVRRFGNIPVYGSNGRVGWHDQALVKGPGIVVGRKGNPGIITWAPTDFFPIDTSFYVQIKDLPLSMYYLFFALRELNLSSLEADSAVPGLNRNIAYNTKLLMPSKEAINKFNVVVGPLFDRADLNNKASETLSVTRDSLLLKLMAGEVAA